MEDTHFRGEFTTPERYFQLDPELVSYFDTMYQGRQPEEDTRQIPEVEINVDNDGDVTIKGLGGLIKEVCGEGGVTEDGIFILESRLRQILSAVLRGITDDTAVLNTTQKEIVRRIASIISGRNRHLADGEDGSRWVTVRTVGGTYHN